MRRRVLKVGETTNRAMTRAEHSAEAELFALRLEGRKINE